MEKSAHFVEERVEIGGSQLDVTPKRVIDLNVRAEHAFATNDAAAEDRGRVVEHDDVHFPSDGGRRQMPPQLDLRVETGAFVAVDLSIEQHADIDIAVAVLAALSHAAENVSGNDPRHRTRCQHGSHSAQRICSACRSHGAKIPCRQLLPPLTNLARQRPQKRDERDPLLWRKPPRAHLRIEVGIRPP